MTYLEAALTILTYTDRPLTLLEITAVAVAQGLVRPRGKTPDRTMASVLYRRMAADPDAPIISRGARFWLRGRPLPAEEASYLDQRARRSRHGTQRATAAEAARRQTDARRAAILPPPPLRLPDELLRAAATPAGRAAPSRRERGIARAGQRGERLLRRLAERRAADTPWTLARTDAQLVAPLLHQLGYRAGREAQGHEGAARGVRAYTLLAGGAPAIALRVRCLARHPGDDDAWHALAQARKVGASYAAVTNGHHLYLYADAIATARDDVAAALVLTLDLAPVDGAARDAQAAALWLLSREAVAEGALDAYVADRAVGAALLDALDAPDSALATALLREVRRRSGLALPAPLVLRHARLALRGRRGRDGEPLPEDIATVAAVRGPRLSTQVQESAHSA